MTNSVALLALFKYADFFIDSFNAVTGLAVPLLKLALPVGISFYTFQSISYTVDVYREPQFEGQTKTKLGNGEVVSAVSQSAAT